MGSITKKTCSRCGATISDGGGTIPLPPEDPQPPISSYAANTGAEVTSVSETDAGESILNTTVVEEYSYVYSGGRLMQMVVKTTVDNGTPATETLNFAYDASGSPISASYGGDTYYYSTNLQGDVTAILNSAGTAVVSYTYDAWGNILSTAGSMVTTLGELNPLRYRGYVYDRESGLYYLQSRYYNPEVGRFINADALVSTGQGLLSNNMFTYCLNNPVQFGDHSGMVARLTCVAIYDGGVGCSRDNQPLQRDVTAEITVALTKASSRGRTLRAVYDNIYGGDIIFLANIYVEFYNLVNHEAPWDIKRQQPWENTIGTPYPGYNANVIFEGNIMTPENLGNFTYGYLGCSYGIPLEQLFAGSYYAAGFPTERADLCNEAIDWCYIAMGYFYAQNGYLEGRWT